MSKDETDIKFGNKSVSVLLIHSEPQTFLKVLNSMTKEEIMECKSVFDAEAEHISSIDADNIMSSGSRAEVVGNLIIKRKMCERRLSQGSIDPSVQ